MKSALIAFLFILTSLFTQQAISDDRIYTSLWNNDAVGGYDTVAFFTQREAVPGNSEYSYKWKGANWLFSSPAHLNLFRENPEKYAPQYGGHCSWAVAVKNDLVKGDPKHWRIVDDKLYLNYDESIQKLWMQSYRSFIIKGDLYWPALIQ
ncbi:YHS domain-containing (seleno)protein [Sansalvadorimonas verongulae]|uniref:YHS domain-containing (seleno)protein n=1 Tax=Sansalvadorimonas verongulae TaxID=2172824 RepID=UPI0012BBD759|nr:YHS domain-containing (seleno)protein [Sansalvadorimonas verongulae]MTI14626.1 YHS domain-containing protein [Sansalvadorimonas verongulae]